MKKFSVLIIFFFLLLASGLRQAQAQTLSLSLWPPLLEVMIQPGRAVTQVYKLTNNSESELTVVPVVYPFSPRGELGQIKIETIEDKNNFFSFASGEKLNQPFGLPVGQTKDLVLRVFIPKNTPENDFYYTLLFSTTTAPTETLAEGGQTSSVTQIGANILLTVSKTGKPVILGRIIRFSAPMLVDSFSPVNFEVVLENWGRAFWKPNGKIQIKGILKQNKELKLLEQNILTNSARRLSVSAWKPKLPLGPFKARLSFVPVEGTSPEEKEGQELAAEISFWYLPYKALGIFLAVIFCLILIKKIRHIRTKKILPLDKMFPFIFNSGSEKSWFCILYSFLVFFEAAACFKNCPGGLFVQP